MEWCFTLEGRDLAKHLGCIFMETSAKQPINVDEAFYSVVREIRKYNKVRVFFLRHRVRVLHNPPVWVTGAEGYPPGGWTANRIRSGGELG